VRGRCFCFQEQIRITEKFMSQVDISITNEMVIPVIETDLFSKNQESRFALGMLAVGNDIIEGREDLFEGYLRLRASVYAYQTRMIPTEHVREDGTEVDEDDSRSVHWAIFEQDGDDASLARVVASIRTIIKSEEDPRVLPIEEFYPDSFKDPVPLGGVEVSRYISRHEDDSVQKQLSHPMFKAVVGYLTARCLGPTYGVVEEPIEAQLARHGVPMRRIAEPKYVPEYADFNLGFEAYVPAMAMAWGMDNQATLDRLVATEKDINYFNVNEAQQEVA
jgi:N-acyl-L-homoserine lactone synthetase